MNKGANPRNKKYPQRDILYKPAVGCKAESSVVNKNLAIVSISGYRKILNDNISTDEQVIKRWQYFEALIRNIIRAELQNHDKKNSSQKAGTT